MGLFDIAVAGKLSGGGGGGSTLITKSITANGTYNATNDNADGYSEVNVNVSGGTLVTKNVTANGTYNASDDNAYGYSKVTVNVSGGGGGTVAEKSDVNFYDYDGTIRYSYTATDAAALASLPENPTHTGLTSQGWNYTLAQMKTEVADHGKCDIGQMYVTDDDTTRIYCTFEDGRLSPYLGICPNGTVVVDWGDGTATDTLTGTSLTTVQTVQHTYASAGDYTITLTVSSGTFALYGDSRISYILRKDTTSTASIHRVYTNAVRKVELGSTASIGEYAFNGCANIASVTIPSSLTSIGSNAFYSCYSLASITLPSSLTSMGSSTLKSCYSLASVTIPSSLTSIGSDAFYSCYSLASVVLPSSLTSMGLSAFYGCYSLASVVLPSSLTSMGSSAFYSCYSLASVTIPSGVTSIGASAFYGCYGMAEYRMNPTTPPTLSNTNAFTNIQSDCKIYVPTGTLATYQAASNWSTYASYMVEA